MPPARGGRLRLPVVWAALTLCSGLLWGAWHAGAAVFAIRSYSQLQSPCTCPGPNCSGGGGGSGGSAAATAEEQAQAVGPEERSYYSRWIDHDLSHWNETGITKQMVDHAFALARMCEGAAIRIQIINGSVWAENAEPPPEGYYPQQYGPGWVSAKGRVAYYLLAIMEALHLFPGQIPDLDIVAQAGDYPCITKKGTIYDGRTITPPWIKHPQDAKLAANEAADAGFSTPQQAKAAAAPPLLSFNSRKGYRDLPFPDYSYFGHEVGTLNDAKGKWIYGWDAQLDHYVARFGNASLPSRWPQVIWRGRHDGDRDVLRKTFVGCYNYLEKKGEDPRVINIWENWGFSGIDLQNICNWRFLAYLESFAWSTSLKQKLACGSVVMTPVMECYEFFGRELQPGVHYIEVAHQPGVMCDDIARNVKAMNAWLNEQKQTLEQQQGASTARQDPSAEATAHQAASEGKARRQLHEFMQTSEGRAEWQWALQQHRRHLLGVWGYPAKKARDKYANPWDSDLTPIEIAQNGRQFLLDHVRMIDVRLYIRDLLVHYAKLQRFTPKPQPRSKRYTGNMLLSNMEIPHRVDAFQLASQYPWLTYWGEK